MLKLKNSLFMITYFYFLDYFPFGWTIRSIIYGRKFLFISTKLLFPTLLSSKIRFTPYEWPTNDQQEKPENQFTLLNCLWFAIGNLFHFGTVDFNSKFHVTSFCPTNNLLQDRWCNKAAIFCPSKSLFTLHFDILKSHHANSIPHHGRLKTLLLWKQSAHLSDWISSHMRQTFHDFWVKWNERKSLQSFFSLLILLDVDFSVAFIYFFVSIRCFYLKTSLCILNF